MTTANVSFLGGLRCGHGHPVRILGVINVGPGSFYGGSVVNDRANIQERARELVAEGADIIDIGARSTAPYLADQTSLQEETRLMGAAIEAIREAVSVPVSADTPRLEPLRAAIAAGATILNDVHGLRDPAVAALAAEHGLDVIAMAHPGDSAPEPDPLGVVRRELEGALDRATAAGIALERITLDPGIGFFRPDDLPWYVWDTAVLRDLRSLEDLGRPLLIGLSRKSFIGAILNQPDPADRLPGSLAATAIAVVNGAAVIRTHDVAATVQAVRLAEKLRA